jgi:hypothetical protein
MVASERTQLSFAQRQMMKTAVLLDMVHPTAERGVRENDASLRRV